MKVLQINTTVNTGSTGRIAEDIGKLMIARGHDSAVAYGRGDQTSESQKIKIGNKWHVYSHVIQTRLFDNHGFASKRATQKLVKVINTFNPDIIGLHNIHGYYIHVGELFSYLKAINIPVVWTFHDCWPFTGHCSYFDRVNCQKWKTQCHSCPLVREYPKSLIVDRSFKNYFQKKEIFQGHPNLTIVTPSHWLGKLVKESFLKDYPVEVIHNGIDIDVFKPREEPNRNTVLGVAGLWTDRKGLKDFLKLRKLLHENTPIVLIGLSNKQINNLPIGITGISRTESVYELADWYSKAAVYVNPTYVDNFPTTNIEALACGTPVVTYNTGGSPEAIDSNTGTIVSKGDVQSLAEAVHKIINNGKETYLESCRDRAVGHFNAKGRFSEYLKLYEKLILKGKE